MKDSKLYVILFTFIISFIFVFILALANELTKEKVKINEELFQRKAILSAMGIEYKDDNDAYNIFNEKIKVKKVNGIELYTSNVDGNDVYAVIFVGNGLWSTIRGVLAVDKNLTEIVGIDFITQSETPGLGGRIEEKWFKDQFRFEKIKDGKIHMIIGGIGKGDFDHENGEFEAITGATRTSESVALMLNKYLSILKDLLGGDLNE
ncbi:Na+-transporting NADH:ubiquinone oxidoreductase subunit C [Marinitoga hydrogenitolerans DSM 16785]|uniref:Na+-transporting NADH:ubiquinone oxidoreductase subunit C n=1 Tax=Marinitoga hydrogenitolerans (strain DSM 16785 / JCM 12826 / AT1271) TaxID=1122195 RepID=A0A1M4X9Y7_MARH1|nr:FMN-binding protein [Marinitoga hydrogenitolerans]SHE90236.1 Na+-transporting NADH:ubiquinone oxidoreductase subunit C [Marinitoga hydrogenitolerans DSM 16785]